MARRQREGLKESEEEKREDEEQQAQARMQLEVNRLARAAELKREADGLRADDRVRGRRLESCIPSTFLHESLGRSDDVLRPVLCGS